MLLASVSSALSSSAQNTTRRASGVISGRVVDDEGRPMRSAEVQALVSVDENGTRRMLSRGNTARTNDRGEFRLFQLAAGMYYIVVNPNPPQEPGRIRGGPPGLGYFPSDPDLTFVTTYFPGVSDIRSAEPVEIGVGEVDIHAIQVAALPSRRIRMRINPTLDEYNSYPLVTVEPIDAPFTPSYPAGPRSFANGQLELRAGLLPGRYRLAVIVHTPGVTYGGGAILVLDLGDPEIIDVPVSRTMTVHGQIVGEANLVSLKVRCIPDPATNSGMTIAADVRPNGKFSLEDLLPGTYAIHVDGLGDESYLAAVTLQNEQVPADRIVFPPDSDSITLSLTISERLK